MKKLFSCFLILFLFVSLFSESNNQESLKNSEVNFEEQDVINLITNFDEIGNEFIKIDFSSANINDEVTSILNKYGISGNNAYEKVRKMKDIYVRIKVLNESSEEVFLTTEENYVSKYFKQLKNLCK